MGRILLGRLLAEFGDDPDTFADAAARRAYVGISPAIVECTNREHVPAVIALPIVAGDPG